MTKKDKAMTIVNELQAIDLGVMYEVAAEVGEIPYQANLRALKAIDIKSELDSGIEEIDLMLFGIDFLKNELESLRDATEDIGNITDTLLRST